MLLPALDRTGHRFVRSTISLTVALIAALLFSAGGPRAEAQTTFTCSAESGSNCALSVSASQTGASTSSFTVPTAGTIQSISVELYGVWADGETGLSMGGAEFLLTGPGGEFDLLGETGDTTDGDDQGDAGSGLHGLNIVIEDGQPGAPMACGSLCSAGESNNWPAGNGSSVGHAGTTTDTVKPGSYFGYNPSTHDDPPLLGVLGDWPDTDGCNPDPILTGYNGATSCSSPTLTTKYGTTAANGTWTLTVENGAGVNTAISITNWSVTITYNASIVSTSTAIVSNGNPSNASNTVNFTATVSSSSGTPTGNVAFTANGTTISGCGSKALNGSGQATCTASLSQGNNLIEAAYTPTGNYGSSNSTMTQLVEVTATQSSNTWCNSGQISAPGNSAGLQYPSFIHVTGYPGGTTVSNVTVALDNATGPAGVNAYHLLVAPNGQNLDFFDTTFAYEQPSSPVNLTISDTAGVTPSGSSAPSSGSYDPYDGNNNGIANDGFPPSSSPAIDSSIPQVPGTINRAAPLGGTSLKTFEQAFSNAPANGDWSLYVYAGGGESETVQTGWCVTFDVNSGVATTTSVSANPNPQTTGQTATITATVTASGSPVTSGTVTFLDGGQTPAGTVGGNNVVSLNSAGQAAFSTSSLSEGDHTFTATYNGTSNDDGSYGTVVQRINDTTTLYGNGVTISHGPTCGATFCYCNPGPISTTATYKGAFTPNPSIISVPSLPGTISSVTLGLNQYSSATTVLYALESMVVGPTGADLDYFSNAGYSSGGGTAQLGNYIFSDAAGSTIPSGVSTLSPGTYKPTSFTEGNPNWPEPAQPYFASASGFYTLPSGITYATPRGSPGGTFTGQFEGTNPDGNWALYMTEDDAAGSASAANGWCVNFTENPVTVAVDLSHQGDGVGTDFVQSETGAVITTLVTAANNTGSTGDPLGTNPLKVTDTIPTGLTYQSASGTGWSCSYSSPTVTCTNDSSEVEGASYPTLTFNVNVAANAPASISNSVNVTGAGITGNSGNDTITVDPTPVLSVSKSHTGSFTQGATGEWDITVSNTVSGSATSGTVTVADTLPSGYTLASYTSSGSLWNCGTIGSGSVSCTATPGIAGGSSSTINLMVNIPAGSPTSVSNTASAWGGGDTTHTSQGTAAISNTSTVSVNQVPASITVSSGNGQSATVNTPFGNELVVLVEDGGGQPVVGTTVTFTVNPAGNGAGGIFSNSTGTITHPTNNGGQAAEPINANFFAGSYTVTAQAGTASTSFSLTNTAGAPATISITGGNNQSAQEGSGFTLPLAVQVSDTFGNPVPGVTVTFTPPTSGASLTFAGGVNTAITDSTGTAASTAITANSAIGSYQVTASAGALQVPFSLSNTVGALAQFALGTPSSAFAGVPMSFTVTAEDSGSNTITNYAGTVTFSSTDGAAMLPAAATLTNGTGSFTATLNTLGPQTITATDAAASVTSTSNSINVVAVPYFVVSVATDDAGDPSLCNPQSSPGTTTDANCSLRDALLASANAGAGSISFSTSAFSSAQTIPLSNGTLTIPSSTIVTGPTMGSGASLKNLVTVNGGGSANNAPVFTTNSSASGSAIQNLIVTNGYGGGIFNGYAAALTIQNSTIYDNNSPSGASGVFNDYNATLTITNSTISGNTGAYGAIVSEQGGTVTVNESTISGNSAINNGGGGILSGGISVSVTNSTITGNSAYSGGGIQISGGTLSLAGSIVAGNTASAFDADINGAATGSYNLIGDGSGLTGITNGSNGNQIGATGSPINPQLAVLGNYGGPTQTLIPLPGSVAICASSLSLIPVGVTTDQRGDLWQPAGGYCPEGTIDTGSVQSNYGISFTTQPPASAVGGLAITPSPVVSLSENGSSFTAANTGTVNMTDSASLLGGTTSEGLSSGAASFNNLVISGPTTNDILTATLPLNGGIGITTQATTGISVKTTLATLTPSSGTLSASQLFTWNNGTGVVDFALWVGTTGENSNDVYDSRETTATSTTVAIPSHGVPIYVTLRQLVNGTWQITYYTFMEPGTPTPATLTPASGTLSASQLFTWNNGAGPVAFALWVGTTGPNSNNVYDSLETRATSATVSIPSNGVPIYVTLRQLINGTWQITYYTFMEPGTPTPATLTPSSGTLQQSQLFTWNNGAGPVDFALWLGTTGVNSNNLYDSLETTATSATVSIPPNGVTVYATLRQLINGTWQISRYTFAEPLPAAVTVKPTTGTP